MEEISKVWLGQGIYGSSKAVLNHETSIKIVRKKITIPEDFKATPSDIQAKIGPNTLDLKNSTSIVVFNSQPLPAINLKKHKLILNRPYVNGKNLQEILEIHRLKQSKISNKQIYQIMIELCSGIEILHSHSPPLIHGGIKPTNIIVENLNPVSLTLVDNGIAPILYNNMNIGHMATNPEYLPPELLNENILKLGSDVFLLGYVFFELCTLDKPFMETERDQFVSAIAEIPINEKLLQQRPSLMRDLIAQMLLPFWKNRPNLGFIIRQLKFGLWRDFWDESSEGMVYRLELGRMEIIDSEGGKRMEIAGVLKYLINVEQISSSQLFLIYASGRESESTSVSVALDLLTLNMKQNCLPRGVQNSLYVQGKILTVHLPPKLYGWRIQGSLLKQWKCINLNYRLGEGRADGIIEDKRTGYIWILFDAICIQMYDLSSQQNIHQIKFNTHEHILGLIPCADNILSLHAGGEIIRIWGENCEELAHYSPVQANNISSITAIIELYDNTLLGLDSNLMSLLHWGGVDNIPINNIEIKGLPSGTHTLEGLFEFSPGVVGLRTSHVGLAVNINNGRVVGEWRFSELIHGWKKILKDIGSAFYDVEQEMDSGIQDLDNLNDIYTDNILDYKEIGINFIKEKTIEENKLEVPIQKKKSSLSSGSLIPENDVIDTHFALGLEDGSIEIYSPHMQKIKLLELHTHRIIFFLTTPGKLLALGADKLLSIWNISEGQTTGKMSLSGSPINGCWIDARHLMLEYKSYLEIIDPHLCKILHKMNNPENSKNVRVAHIFLHPRTAYIWRCLDKNIYICKIIHIPKGQQKKGENNQFTIDIENTIQTRNILHSGVVLLSGKVIIGGESKLFYYEEDGKAIHAMSLNVPGETAVRILELSNGIPVVGTSRGNIYFVNIEERTIIRQFQPHIQTIVGIIEKPGNQILTGSEGKTLLLTKMHVCTGGVNYHTKRKIKAMESVQIVPLTNIRGCCYIF